MQRLSVKALALAGGIVWAVAVLAMGLFASYFNWGKAFIDGISSVYVGFEATVKGSLIGAAWGFVDAGIGLAIFALLYNAFLGKKKTAAPAEGG